METTQTESENAFKALLAFATNAKIANTDGFGTGLWKLFISYKRQLRSTDDTRCFAEVLQVFAEKCEQLYASATDSCHKGNHIPRNWDYPELIGKNFPDAVKYLANLDRSPTAVLKSLGKDLVVGRLNHQEPLKVAM